MWIIFGLWYPSFFRTITFVVFLLKTKSNFSFILSILVKSLDISSINCRRLPYHRSENVYQIRVYYYSHKCNLLRSFNDLFRKYFNKFYSCNQCINLILEKSLYITLASLVHLSFVLPWQFLLLSITNL